MIFVAVFIGSGRPTGWTCEAEHSYEPPREGEQFGGYVGAGCWHSVESGYLAPSLEVATEDFLRGEHLEIGHREPEPGCPLCSA